MAESVADIQIFDAQIRTVLHIVGGNLLVSLVKKPGIDVRPVFGSPPSRPRLGRKIIDIVVQRGFQLAAESIKYFTAVGAIDKDTNIQVADAEFVIDAEVEERIGIAYSRPVIGIDDAFTRQVAVLAVTRCDGLSLK